MPARRIDNGVYLACFDRQALRAALDQTQDRLLEAALGIRIGGVGSGGDNADVTGAIPLFQAREARRFYR